MNDRILSTNPRLFRIMPPIACLIYPTLVSCISGVSSFFLILVILIPICCGYVAFHLAGTGLLKGSAIAHFAVGAPALYSLMGQWLDSQKLFPFHANEVWIAVWLLLTAISFADKPAIRSESSTSSRLATIHGISAVPILLFAALHLTNHFLGLWGAQAHIAFMLQARRVYRYAAIEIALVSCFAFQFATGILLTWRGIARGLADDWMKRLQRISGAYLAVFLMSHFSAVARARYLRHSDTNWTLAYFVRSPHG